METGDTKEEAILKKPHRSPLVGWTYTDEELAKMNRAVAESKEYLDRISTYVPCSGRVLLDNDEPEKDEEAEPEYELTSVEATAYLGINIQMLGHAVRKGFVLRKKINGTLYYNIASLDAWAERFKPKRTRK